MLEILEQIDRMSGVCFKLEANDCLVGGIALNRHNNETTTNLKD